jgi:hypothetical protein
MHFLYHYLKSRVPKAAKQIQPWQAQFRQESPQLSFCLSKEHYLMIWSLASPPYYYDTLLFPKHIRHCAGRQPVTIKGNIIILAKGMLKCDVCLMKLNMVTKSLSSHSLILVITESSDFNTLPWGICRGCIRVAKSSVSCCYIAMSFKYCSYWLVKPTCHTLRPSVSLSK